MWILVTYDLKPPPPAGRPRLRQVARICEGYGQRVQNSVFECLVDDTTAAILRARLLDTFFPQEDSLRFYYLGSSLPDKSEHHGQKPSFDMEGPLIL
jgi:CRISPR-associated protein Cas2